MSGPLPLTSLPRAADEPAESWGWLSEVEDAINGVAAGHAGDFALVIGVDRGAGHEALTRAGADVVVSDLAELLP